MPYQAGIFVGMVLFFGITIGFIVRYLSEKKKETKLEINIGPVTNRNKGEKS